jgi:hypothetical protein
MLATWGSSSGLNALLASSSFSLNFTNGSYTLNSVPYAIASVPGYSFTRASGGYAENVDGSLTYFAGTRTNTLLQSQNFENASWNKGLTSITVAATTAPDGTLTGELVSATATTGEHHIEQNVSFVNGTTISISVMAKTASTSILFLWNSRSGSLGSVNLSTGAVTGSVKATLMTNGWYRVSAQYTPSITTSGQIRFYIDSTSSYTATGQSIYLWGAQFETATDTRLTYPTAYIPTTTAAVSVDTPRITNKGYLSEEARTNSIANSTATNGAVAGVIGSGGALPTNWGTLSPTGITITVIGTGTELGLPYVDIRFSGTATSTAFIEISSNATTAIAASAGQVWTGTSYAKLVSGTLPNGASNWGQTQQAFNAVSLFLSQQFQTGTISSTFARNSGATLTMPANTAYAKTVLSQRTSTANGTVVDFTIRIGAPQMELGAFATSYIPTTTAAATRAADILKFTSISSWYNQTAGTLAVTSDASANTYTTYVAATDGITAQNSVHIDNDSGNMRAVYYSGSAAVATLVLGAVGTVGALTKIATAYAINDFSASRNGGAVVTSSSGALPVSISQLNVGGDPAGVSTQYVDGYIKAVSYYTNRLSDSQLQAITK